MSKLERWPTLGANLSVVAGIVFLAVEMRLNTEATQAQTRDAITEKQMEFLFSIGTNPEAADVFSRGNLSGGFEAGTRELAMYFAIAPANLPEWENSHYPVREGAVHRLRVRAEGWALARKHGVLRLSGDLGANAARLLSLLPRRDRPDCRRGGAGAMIGSTCVSSPVPRLVN